jgi:hypothetical protein
MKKKIKSKLQILEKKLNTNFNYILFEEREYKKKMLEGDDFVYKFSYSEFHQTNFRLNSPFYKSIYQPFVVEQDERNNIIE